MKHPNKYCPTAKECIKAEDGKCRALIPGECPIHLRHEREKFRKKLTKSL